MHKFICKQGDEMVEVYEVRCGQCIYKNRKELEELLGEFWNSGAMRGVPGAPPIRDWDDKANALMGKILDAFKGVEDERDKLKYSKTTAFRIERDAYEKEAEKWKAIVVSTEEELSANKFVAVALQRDISDLNKNDRDVAEAIFAFKAINPEAKMLTLIEWANQTIENLGTKKCRCCWGHGEIPSGVPGAMNRCLHCGGTGSIEGL